MSSHKLEAWALICAVLCALALSGCIETRQQIVVDQDGMALITISAIADKTMAGDQLNQFAWQVEQLIPQLNTDYQRRNYTLTEGFTQYLVYEWMAKKKVPVTDIKGVSWSKVNGSYQFSMAIEPLFNLTEVDENSRNEVVMEINLTMPQPVDGANTPYVTGSSARWVITKELLTQQNVLQAASKPAI